MSDNSDANDLAKFAALDCIRTEIPYSPVLQELRRKGNTECLYWRNPNGISDSYSNSDTSLERQRKETVQKDRDIHSSSAKGYASQSSRDVTNVEYATEWYSESQGRPSLSPATKKRYRYQVEDDMAKMSSMSESEIRAVIDE
jgi:hypothetical protein